MRFFYCLFTIVLISFLTIEAQNHTDKKHIIIMIDFSGSMRYEGMNDNDLKNWNAALSHVLFSGAKSVDGFKYAEKFEDSFITLKSPLLEKGDEFTLLEIGTSVKVIFDRETYDGNSNIIISKLPTKISDFNSLQTNLEDAQEKFLQFIKDSYDPHAVVLTDGENTIYNDNSSQAIKIKNRYHIITPVKYILNKRVANPSVFLEILKVKSEPGDALKFKDVQSSNKYNDIVLSKDGKITPKSGNYPEISLADSSSRVKLTDLSLWLVVFDSELKLKKEVIRKIDTEVMTNFPIKIDLFKWMLESSPGTDSLPMFNTLFGWSGKDIKENDSGLVYTKVICRYRYDGMLKYQELPLTSGEYIKWSFAKVEPSKGPQIFLIIVSSIFIIGLLWFGTKVLQKPILQYSFECDTMNLKQIYHLKPGEIVFLGKQTKLKEKFFDLNSPNIKVNIEKNGYLMSNSTTNEKEPKKYDQDVKIIDISGTQITMKIRKVLRSNNSDKSKRTIVRAKK